jgi:predicted deacylase
MYHEYIDSILKICKNKSFKVNYKILGSFRFYYITLNEDKYDKTIVFSSGIHGDEIAGPHAVKKFLLEHDELKHRVILFPVANPYGFDKCIRFNALNQDINRNFCDPHLTGEAKVIYNVLKRVKPDLFVSLHEWPAKDGYYMWCSEKEKKEKLQQIPEIASKYFKVYDSKKINEEEAKKGIIWHPEKDYEIRSSKCTLENKMYNSGVHYMCIETPNKGDLDKRVNCKFDIMNYILKNYYG